MLAPTHQHEFMRAFFEIVAGLLNVPVLGVLLNEFGFLHSRRPSTYVNPCYTLQTTHKATYMKYTANGKPRQHRGQRGACSFYSSGRLGGLTNGEYVRTARTRSRRVFAILRADSRISGATSTR